MNVPPMELPTWSDWCRYASASRCPEIWEGLVMAYAPTLGATGQTLYDISGMGRDGTLNTFATTAWSQTSPYGSWCLDFDGGSDYISFPNTLDFDMHCSVSAWINPDTAAVGSMVIFQAASSSTAADISVQINAVAGAVRLRWDNFNGLDSSAVLTAGTWTHIVAVRSGTTSNWTLSIYINGVLNASTTSTTNTNSTAPGYTIGRRTDAAAAYYNGRLGDLLVYNKALDARDVSNLYSSGVEWLLPALPIYGKAPAAAGNRLLLRMMEERLFIRGMAA